MTNPDPSSTFDELDLPLDPAVHARRWVTLGVLCLSLMIIVMDNTILNVAIPSLMGDLGASNTDIQWIIDAYTLVFACLLLTTGSLSDRFGRKGALQLGIVLFALGSTSAALSSNVIQLIFSRAFMGIGGALIMPATLSILTNVFRDPKERGRAIAIWAGFSGLSVAIGPVAGGLLLRHFEWSSVFWINIPIAVVAIGLGAYFVPTSRDPSQARIDLGGAVLSVVTLGAFLYSFIEGPVRGWTDGFVLGGFGLGAVGAAAFIAWELHVDEPMLDMRFFANPRFSAANGAITMTFFALFGSMFLMTQYWQLVHGYSPLGAGVRLVPYALCMMVTAPLSARIVERLGAKRVITTGLSIVATALVSLSFIHATTSYPKVIALFCLMAVGMGMTMAPATESVMGALPREKAGVGSAVSNATRQVGGALGVAIIGSIVTGAFANRVGDVAGRYGITGETRSAAQDSLRSAIDVGGSLGAQGGRFVADVKDAFVGSLSMGLRFSAGIIVLAALVVWRFLPARAADPLVQREADAADALADGSVSVAAGGH